MPTKTGIEIEKKFGSSKYSKDSFETWAMQVNTQLMPLLKIINRPLHDKLDQKRLEYSNSVDEDKQYNETKWGLIRNKSVPGRQGLVHDQKKTESYYTTVKEAKKQLEKYISKFNGSGAKFKPFLTAMCLPVLMMDDGDFAEAIFDNPVTSMMPALVGSGPKIQLKKGSKTEIDFEKMEKDMGPLFEPMAELYGCTVEAFELEYEKQKNAKNGWTETSLKAFAEKMEDVYGRYCKAYEKVKDIERKYPDRFNSNIMENNLNDTFTVRFTEGVRPLNYFMGSAEGQVKAIKNGWNPDELLVLGTIAGFRQFLDTNITVLKDKLAHLTLSDEEINAYKKELADLHEKEKKYLDSPEYKRLLIEQQSLKKSFDDYSAGFQALLNQKKHVEAMKLQADNKDVIAKYSTVSAKLKQANPYADRIKELEAKIAPPSKEALKEKEDLRKYIEEDLADASEELRKLEKNCMNKKVSTPADKLRVLKSIDKFREKMRKYGASYKKDDKTLDTFFEDYENAFNEAKAKFKFQKDVEDGVSFVSISSAVVKLMDVAKEANADPKNAKLSKEEKRKKEEFEDFIEEAVDLNNKLAEAEKSVAAGGDYLATALAKSEKKLLDKAEKLYNGQKNKKDAKSVALDKFIEKLNARYIVDNKIPDIKTIAPDKPGAKKKKESELQAEIKRIESGKYGKAGFRCWADQTFIFTAPFLNYFRPDLKAMLQEAHENLEKGEEPDFTVEKRGLRNNTGLGRLMDADYDPNDKEEFCDTVNYIKSELEEYVSKLSGKNKKFENFIKATNLSVFYSDKGDFAKAIHDNQVLSELYSSVGTLIKIMSKDVETGRKGITRKEIDFDKIEQNLGILLDPLLEFYDCVYNLYLLELEKQKNDKEGWNKQKKAAYTRRLKKELKRVISCYEKLETIEKENPGKFDSKVLENDLNHLVAYWNTGSPRPITGPVGQAKGQLAAIENGWGIDELPVLGAVGEFRMLLEKEERFTLQKLEALKKEEKELDNLQKELDSLLDKEKSIKESKEYKDYVEANKHLKEERDRVEARNAELEKSGKGSSSEWREFQNERMDVIGKYYDYTKKLEKMNPYYLEIKNLKARIKRIHAENPTEIKKFTAHLEGDIAEAKKGLRVLEQDVMSRKVKTEKDKLEVISKIEKFKAKAASFKSGNELLNNMSSFFNLVDGSMAEIKNKLENAGKEPLNRIIEDESSEESFFVGENRINVNRINDKKNDDSWIIEEKPVISKKSGLKAEMEQSFGGIYSEKSFSFWKLKVVVDLHPVLEKIFPEDDMKLMNADIKLQESADTEESERHQGKTERGLRIQPGLLGMDYTKHPEAEKEKFFTMIKQIKSRMDDYIKGLKGTAKEFEPFLKACCFSAVTGKGDYCEAQMDNQLLGSMSLITGTGFTILTKEVKENGKTKTVVDYDGMKESLGDIFEPMMEMYACYNDLFELEYQRQKNEKEGWDSEEYDRFRASYKEILSRYVKSFDKLRSIEDKNPGYYKEGKVKKHGAVLQESLDQLVGRTERTRNSAGIVAHARGQIKALDNGWKIDELPVIGIITEMQELYKRDVLFNTERVKVLEKSIEERRKPVQDELNKLEAQLAELKQKEKQYTEKPEYIKYYNDNKEILEGHDRVEEEYNRLINEGKKAEAQDLLTKNLKLYMEDYTKVSSQLSLMNPLRTEIAILEQKISGIKGSFAEDEKKVKEFYAKVNRLGEAFDRLEKNCVNRKVYSDKDKLEVIAELEDFVNKEKDTDLLFGIEAQTKPSIANRYNLAQKAVEGVKKKIEFLKDSNREFPDCSLAAKKLKEASRLLNNDRNLKKLANEFDKLNKDLKKAEETLKSEGIYPGAALAEREKNLLFNLNWYSKVLDRELQNPKSKINKNDRPNMQNALTAYQKAIDALEKRYDIDKGLINIGYSNNLEVEPVVEIERKKTIRYEKDELDLSKNNINRIGDIIINEDELDDSFLNDNKIILPNEEKQPEKKEENKPEIKVENEIKLEDNKIIVQPDANLVDNNEEKPIENKVEKIVENNEEKKNPVEDKPEENKVVNQPEDNKIVNQPEDNKIVDQPDEFKNEDNKLGDNSIFFNNDFDNDDQLDNENKLVGELKDFNINEAKGFGGGIFNFEHDDEIENENKNENKNEKENVNENKDENVNENKDENVNENSNIEEEEPEVDYPDDEYLVKNAAPAGEQKVINDPVAELNRNINEEVEIRNNLMKSLIEAENAGNNAQAADYQRRILISSIRTMYYAGLKEKFNAAEKNVDIFEHEKNLAKLEKELTSDLNKNQAIVNNMLNTGFGVRFVTSLKAGCANGTMNVSNDGILALRDICLYDTMNYGGKQDKKAALKIASETGSKVFWKNGHAPEVEDNRNLEFVSSFNDKRYFYQEEGSRLNENGRTLMTMIDENASELGWKNNDHGIYAFLKINAEKFMAMEAVDKYKNDPEFNEIKEGINRLCNKYATSPENAVGVSGCIEKAHVITEIRDFMDSHTKKFYNKDSLELFEYGARKALDPECMQGRSVYMNAIKILGKLKEVDPWYVSSSPEFGAFRGSVEQLVKFAEENPGELNAEKTDTYLQHMNNIKEKAKLYLDAKRREENEYYARHGREMERKPRTISRKAFARNISEMLDASILACTRKKDNGLEFWGNEDERALAKLARFQRNAENVRKYYLPKPNEAEMFKKAFYRSIYLEQLRIRMATDPNFTAQDLFNALESKAMRDGATAIRNQFIKNGLDEHLDRIIENKRRSTPENESVPAAEYAFVIGADKKLAEMDEETRLNAGKGLGLDWIKLEMKNAAALIAKTTQAPEQIAGQIRPFGYVLDEDGYIVENKTYKDEGAEIEPPYPVIEERDYSKMNEVELAQIKENLIQNRPNRTNDDMSKPGNEDIARIRQYLRKRYTDGSRLKLAEEKLGLREKDIYLDPSRENRLINEFFENEINKTEAELGRINRHLLEKVNERQRLEELTELEPGDVLDLNIEGVSGTKKLEVLGVENGIVYFEYHGSNMMLNGNTDNYVPEPLMHGGISLQELNNFAKPRVVKKGVPGAENEKLKATERRQQLAFTMEDEAMNKELAVNESIRTVDKKFYTDMLAQYKDMKAGKKVKNPKNDLTERIKAEKQYEKALKDYKEYMDPDLNPEIKEIAGEEFLTRRPIPLVPFEFAVKTEIEKVDVMRDAKRTEIENKYAAKKAAFDIEPRLEKAKEKYEKHLNSLNKESFDIGADVSDDKMLNFDDDNSFNFSNDNISVDDALENYSKLPPVDRNSKKDSFDALQVAYRRLACSIIDQEYISDNITQKEAENAKQLMNFNDKRQEFINQVAAYPAYKNALENAMLDTPPADNASMGKISDLIIVKMLNDAYKDKNNFELNQTAKTVMRKFGVNKPEIMKRLDKPIRDELTKEGVEMKRPLPFDDKKAKNNKKPVGGKKI